MTTNFYRFPDHDTFRTLAAAEGLIATDSGGIQTLITSSHAHSLDEIGTITTGGSWNPETGDVIEPPVILDGWHVNTSDNLAPEAWEPYLIVVNTPVRVFFGVEP